MPLVSIIIPSYNNLVLLKKCIDSIRRQTFIDYEVLIIDGESTDGTKQYLENLNKPFKWVSEPDYGIYDAMNKGIGMSKGRWLYFIGADDYLFDNNVLKDIFSIKITNSVRLIIGKVQYEYASNDSITIKYNKGLFEPSWSNKIWIKNTIHHQGAFYKSELFSNNNFNIHYKVLADYDFNLGLYIKNENIHFVDRTIAFSKANGISKKYNWQLYEEEISIKTKHSSIVLMPIFYIVGLIKYLLKKFI